MSTSDAAMVSVRLVPPSNYAAACAAAAVAALRAGLAADLGVSPPAAAASVERFAVIREAYANFRQVRTPLSLSRWIVQPSFCRLPSALDGWLLPPAPALSCAQPTLLLSGAGVAGLHTLKISASDQGRALFVNLILSPAPCAGVPLELEFSAPGLGK